MSSGGPSGAAVDLVCDAEAGRAPDHAGHGFAAAVVGGPGRMLGGPAAPPVAWGAVPAWPCLNWDPAPGCDPAVTAVLDLDETWTGLVRYVPASAEGLAPWLVEPVAAALASVGRPLLVWWRHAEPLPLERLVALGVAVPGLTVVLASDSDQPSRLMACLAAALPHLLLATTAFAPATLAAVAGAAGPERLVLGSGHPTGSADAALGRVADLGLGEPAFGSVVRDTARALVRAPA